MILDEIRNKLPENTLVFNDPSFDESIIGYVDNDTVSGKPRAVYSFDHMVEEYAEENDCTMDEAADFISYNTLGAYAGDGTPIVITLLDNVEITKQTAKG